jgi:hypothetical protein
MALTEKQSVNLYQNAHQLASAAMSALPGLPSGGEVHSLACAFIAAHLVSPGGKGGIVRNHAGADSEQESMLQDSYEGGSQVGR